MPHHSIRRVFSFFALTAISASFALAQSATAGEPDLPTSSTWDAAQLIGSAKGNLFVVARDQPDRKQGCRVQSFAPDELVCSRRVGSPRTYLPNQILALIVPGDHEMKIRFVAGLNGGLAVAIWGTVALAAACPACAAVTGVVALLLFCAAGAVLVGDEQPNRLLYLAAGQQLSPRLGFVEH